MSIIIRPEYIEHAEREFDAHPDVAASLIAAEFALQLADRVPREKLHALRIDINDQVLADRTRSRSTEETPITVNFAGQVKLPEGVHVALGEVARGAATAVLEQVGYFRSRDFPQELLQVNVAGITPQSPLLNGTSSMDQFADMCRVEGYYIAGNPEGVFPSLRLANAVNDAIGELISSNRLPDLRPDGKVHALVEYDGAGYRIREVVVNSAHAGRPVTRFRKELEELLRADLIRYGYDADFPISVNTAGDFHVYFVQADSGVSKTKDDVLLTGGLHQLGTDRVWGKCLYKASSVLLPYAFALARAACEATGARYAAVSAASRYGDATWEVNGKPLLLQVSEIDPQFLCDVPALNAAFANLPHTPSGIREVLGMPVTSDTYRAFNDVVGWHHSEKPWKRYNIDLVRALQR